MKFRCAKHGSSLHCHGCKHVVEACNQGSPLPSPGNCAGKRTICNVCCTPRVEKLISEMTDNLEHFFDCYSQLQKEIGYTHLCTECLYEKTGLDLRRQ